MYKFSNKEHTAVTNLETGASGIHQGVWMWEQYQEWVKDGGVTEAFDTRTPEDIFKDEKHARQQANKDACKAHILQKYPLEIQSSAALGLYTEAETTALQDYIADHLEEENTVFDLLQAAKTMEELDAVRKPVWPEV